MHCSVIEYDVLTVALNNLRNELKVSGSDLTEEYTQGEIRAAIEKLELRLIKDNIPY